MAEIEAQIDYNVPKADITLLTPAANRSNELRVVVSTTPILVVALRCHYSEHMQ